MNTKRRIQRGLKQFLCILLLMVAGSMTGYAQSNCFEYDVNDGNVITGLTEEGLNASSLTIPATVTTVKSGAFSSTSAKVSALVIEAGGNPAFETELFGELENPLSDIQILGNSMTLTNINDLFTSLGSQGSLSTVYIHGYSGEWTDIEETSVLTNTVSVALPAALVTTQRCLLPHQWRLNRCQQSLSASAQQSFISQRAANHR